MEFPFVFTPSPFGSVCFPFFRRKLFEQKRSLTREVPDKAPKNLSVRLGGATVNYAVGMFLNLNQNWCYLRSLIPGDNHMVPFVLVNNLGMVFSRGA